MSDIAKQFFSLEPGCLVTNGSHAYRVTHLISVDKVIGVDLATSESHQLPVETLQLVTEGDLASQNDESAKDLLEYSQEEWQEGQRRFNAIKPLLANPMRTREDAEKVAREHSVHVGTLYRWLAAYIEAGHMSVLVPRKRGRKTGTTLLDATLEAIVQSTITDTFLHPQRRTAQQVIEDVERRCRLAKIEPPHPNTIRSRIKAIPNKTVLRRRGQREAATNLYAPIRGSFPGAEHPFAVVQIDHTPLDIVCVDELHRKAVARPYLTLAIDVATRMVAGFYLSYDPPSAASVGLCLAQAMCPKREYLAELGVAGQWPVWGRIETVHCDNAKEFRGLVLERACEENGINLAWRPVKTPRYGGHIERMMGTVAREVHKLPGTTFANTRARKGYDSEAEASLTLKEVERHLAEFFLNVYHQRKHSELGMPPIRKWELGVVGDGTSPGIGLMPLPQDPERILLDFMPFVERTVQPYGLQIDKINYYDPVLDPYINALDPSQPESAKSKRSFIVRRDPRNISKVHFFDPVAKRYCPIPYRNLAHPAMSLYELREARRILEAEGRKDVDEVLIFEALDRMRARVDEAQQRTKAARRQVQRRPRAAEAPSLPAPPAVMPQTAHVAIATPSLLDDDPFSEPIRPFDDLAMKR